MYQAFNYYQNGIKTHVTRTKSKIDDRSHQKRTYFEKYYFNKY